MILLTVLVLLISSLLLEVMKSSWVLPFIDHARWEFLLGCSLGFTLIFPPPSDEYHGGLTRCLPQYEYHFVG